MVALTNCWEMGRVIWFYLTKPETDREQKVHIDINQSHVSVPIQVEDAACIHRAR